MTALALETFAPKAGLKLYVETSAALSVTLTATAAAEGYTAPHLERDRARRLSTFLERGHKNGARALCSVLVFEEIAAKVRNEERRVVLVRESEPSWRDYERARPADAAAASVAIQQRVLKVLEYAVTALSKLGVMFEQPVVTNAAEAGKKLRKAHREFIRLYDRIDSMDALHIAFGLLLGCKHFISFDRAWETIAEIELLN